MGCRVRSPLLRADGFPEAEGRATGQRGPLIAEELSWKAMMLLFLASYATEKWGTGGRFRSGEGGARRSKARTRGTEPQHEIARTTTTTTTAKITRAHFFSQVWEGARAVENERVDRERGSREATRTKHSSSKTYPSNQLLGGGLRGGLRAFGCTGT